MGRRSNARKLKSKKADCRSDKRVDHQSKSVEVDQQLMGADQKEAEGVGLFGLFVGSENATGSQPENLLDDNYRESTSRGSLSKERLGLKAYLKGKNKKMSDLQVLIIPKKNISSETVNLVGEKTIKSPSKSSTSVGKCVSNSEELRLQIAVLSEDEDASLQKLDRLSNALTRNNDSDIDTSSLESPSAEKNRTTDSLNSESHHLLKKNGHSNGESCESDSDISTELFPAEVESTENLIDISSENTKTSKTELQTCQRLITWLGIHPGVFAQAAFVHNGDVDKAVQWMLSKSVQLS